MTEEELRQEIRDEEHLKLLSILYKVSAGITAFYSLFGLFYVLMGAVFLVLPMDSPSAGDPPPAFFGWFLGVLGFAFLLIGLTMAALKWRVGTSLKQRKSPTFCKVIAGIICLGIPYGTALGVATFVVLSRPSIARLFDGQKQEPGEANGGDQPSSAD